MKHELTSFTAPEVEALTTVAMPLQRLWRQRGYLPAQDGRRARMDVFDVAEILTLKLLADRGIGPNVGKAVGAWCAAGIVFHAFADAGEPELGATLIRGRGFGGAIPGRWFVWFADDSHVFSPTIELAFVGEPMPLDELSAADRAKWDALLDPAAAFRISRDAVDTLIRTDPATPRKPSRRVNDPVVLLDLQALGAPLRTRAGKPLAVVKRPFSTVPLPSPPAETVTNRLPLPIAKDLAAVMHDRWLDACGWTERQLIADRILRIWLDCPDEAQDQTRAGINVITSLLEQLGETQLEHPAQVALYRVSDHARWRAAAATWFSKNPADLDRLMADWPTWTAFGNRALVIFGPADFGA